MPQDKCLAIWNIFIAVVLLWSCMCTPFQLALVDEVSAQWATVNYTVDFIFLFEIIINFNTAFYDDDYNLILDRGQIACHYI